MCPDTVVAHVTLVTVEPLLRLGRRAEAESLVVTLTRTGPGKPDFRGALDRDLVRAGRSPELESRLLSELGRAAVEAPGERPWLLLFSLRNQGRLRDAQGLAVSGQLPNGARVAFGDPLSQGIVAFERGRYDEAARQFQRVLFDELGFHRLELEIYGFNERAIAHAERSGFVREGVKRRAYLRNGEWVDGVLFGLLAEDPAAT